MILVLLAVILVGIWWYHRERPSLRGLAPLPPKVRRIRNPRPKPREPFWEQLEKVFGLSCHGTAQALRTAHRHPNPQVNDFAERWERGREAIANARNRALRRAAAAMEVEDKYLHRAARERRRAAS